MDHLEVIYRLLWNIDEYDIFFFNRPIDRSSNAYTWEFCGWLLDQPQNFYDAIVQATERSESNPRHLYKLCSRDPEEKEVMYFINGLLLHDFNPTHEDLIKLATSPYKETEND